MSNRKDDAGFSYCNKCGNPWPCVRHTDSGDLQEEIDRLRDQIAMLMVELDKWKQCAHAYERGAMGLGDRLIKEASRGQ